MFWCRTFWIIPRILSALSLSNPTLLGVQDQNEPKIPNLEINWGWFGWDFTALMFIFSLEKINFSMVILFSSPIFQLYSLLERINPDHNFPVR